MRALLFDGEPRVVDLPRPQPAQGEVLLEVLRAGVCATDLEITRGYMAYRGVIGHEFVARVVEGPAELQGKRVAAEINCVCGQCDMCTRGLASHCTRRTVIGIQGRAGAFAEFVTAPARNCHILPDSIDDDAAVFVEPLAAAYQILRQVRIEPRDRVMVLGSGRLGLLVGQVLARTRCRLSVVGRNPRTLELLDRLGISSFPVGDVRTGLDQDIVVDCTGSPAGLELAMQMVRPRGTIVLKTTCQPGAPLQLAPLVINEVTLVGSRCGPFPDAIAALARREIEVGAMVTQRVPLSRGAEALAAAARADQIKVLIYTKE